MRHDALTYRCAWASYAFYLLPICRLRVFEAQYEEVPYTIDVNVHVEERESVSFEKFHAVGPKTEANRDDI